EETEPDFPHPWPCPRPAGAEQYRLGTVSPSILWIYVDWAARTGCAPGRTQRRIAPRWLPIPPGIRTFAAPLRVSRPHTKGPAPTSDDIRPRLPISLPR